MKVVLFCGGLGLRIRDYSDKLPKPLVPLGGKPILWHIMKYYAHFGHKEFILCLGYKADRVKEYFLNYTQEPSNDFVLTGGANRQPLHNDIADWRISFVDTGMRSNIGQRLKKVKHLLGGDEYFLANYSDTLTDAPLNEWLGHFTQQDKVASMMCVRPHVSLHSVTLQDNGTVTGIQSARSDMLVNGGFFAFRRDIFDYVDRGEELVEEPFSRLIAGGALLGQPYQGFWATMDTFKDRQVLEEMYATGRAPWEVWKYRRAEERTHVHALAGADPGDTLRSAPSSCEWRSADLTGRVKS